MTTQFPALCLMCRGSMTQHQSVCTYCAHYFKTTTRACYQCAHPLTAHEQDICMQCHIMLPAFDHTIAVTYYQPPIDQLILRLKFYGQLPIAHLFAHQLQQCVTHKDLPLPDLLCPMPISLQRLQERGFNQALEVTKPLSHMLGIPYQAQLCQRQRHTQAQSALTAEERRHNIRQAFYIDPQYAAWIANKHIGVIDDVMTTGETLHELAMILKSWGAVRVTNFVFARTVSPNFSV